MSEPSERRAAAVYTSGEHCPMCSAAHAWVAGPVEPFAAQVRELHRRRFSG